MERITENFPEIFPKTIDRNAQKLGGGANNEVFLINYESKKYVLKIYEKTSSNSRFTNEKKFYEWTSFINSEQVPSAISWNENTFTALFNYVEGNPLPDAINLSHIKQTIDFLKDLNSHRENALNYDIPRASDSGDLFSQYLSVSKRIEILSFSTIHKSVKEEFEQFFNDEFLCEWKLFQKSFEKKFEKDLEIKKTLGKSSLILSPSDIGFHNCIESMSGQLTFFDFEYAGWDDPAKTVSDFLRQPRYFIPTVHWKFFIDSISQLTEDPSFFYNRLNVLLPLHNFKWCCIFLNDFLPNHNMRRLKATDQNPNEPENLINQLKKSQKHLALMKTIPNSLWHI